MNTGRSKLSRNESAIAKQVVRECVLSRFTREESVAYLSKRLNRKDLNVWDFDKLKRRNKNDTEKWVNSMIQTRWAYIAQFKERIDEYYKYEREYWQIFHNNPKKPQLQKGCLDSLQQCSAAIASLYDILPEMAAGNVTTTTIEDKEKNDPILSQGATPQETRDKERIF